MIRALTIGMIAALGVTLTACSSVSGTGRSQFNVMSTSAEKELGASAYAQMLGEPGVKIATQGPAYERVQRIGARIDAASQRLHAKAVKDFEWQWTVIDDPNTVNAWALPGGKSAVYTGMLTMAQNDDELAVVMGHEAAHAIARHGGERISTNILMQSTLQGAQFAVGGLEPATQAAVMAAIGVGSEYGVVLPWSRMQESEADEIGLFIAADAGYDPRAAIPLWERMGASGGDKPPEFMSTHPSEGTRVQRLSALMPKAMQVYEAAKAAGR
ncbi:MAG: M48 family metallopeptidase [Phycisphaerae bacterium]|nr:M48 family metallopeptidase [Phycisphaerae bacterium]